MLIVEDEKSARKAIARILTKGGFAVSEAGSVADAMKELSQNHEWVLLDLMLPDGCGISVLRSAKSQGLASRVCVITGCGEEMLDAARIAGAEHCFKKPVNLPQLMALLAA